MKRINLYLEESQIARIAKLADGKRVSAAEILRRCLEAGLGLHELTGLTADIELVRQKMSEKNNGEEITYLQEFVELARQKAIEYQNKQDNASRITTIVERQDEVIERQDKVEAALKHQAERFDMVEEALGNILKLLERREGDL